MRSVLSDYEKKEFLRPPKFNSYGRTRFFALPEALMSKFKKLPTPIAKVVFILMYGYFKANKRFFASDFHKEDIKFICNKLQVTNITVKDVEEYIIRNMHHRYKKIIMNFLGYSPYNDYYDGLLKQELEGKLASAAKPKDLWFYSIGFLVNKKVEIPSFTCLNQLILDSIKISHKANTKIINENITPHIMEKLDELIDKPQEDGKYKINTLKQITYDGSPSKINSNVDLFKTTQELFNLVNPIMDKLDLNDEGIKYNASMASRYQTSQLQQYKNYRYLYLMSLITHKYYGSQDTLILTLLRSVTNALNQVNKQYKEHCFETKDAQNEMIKKAGAKFKSMSGLYSSLKKIMEGKEDKETKAVTVGRGFRASLYKAIAYIKISKGIKAGKINFINCYKYRSLEEYLIPMQEWQTNKDEIIEKAGLKAYVDIESLLEKLQKKLHNKYMEVNSNINDGKNEHIKMRKDGKFILNTPVREESENSIAELLSNMDYKNLPSIIQYVMEETNFIEAFSHLKGKHMVTKKPVKAIAANMISYGCKLGSGRMSKIAKNINKNEFHNVDNWYFYLENLLNANDMVVRHCSTLPIVKKLKQKVKKIHTSSDGQKFEAASDSENSSYSFKYFGQNMGVSVYSFIDNFNLLPYSVVISAGEREAAWVIDGLMHNHVIKSDIHSTDTHGYTELIFGAMDLIGVSFAPRIKGLNKQQLYAFEPLKGSDNYKIKPSGYIKKDIIIEQWDNILRLMASIILKRSTASQIFRRLNSYAAQNPLYKGFKEYGRIHKSIFALNYIDNVELRQQIERQLNRVEHSHRFARAITYGNENQFIEKLPEEQNMEEACCRGLHH